MIRISAALVVAAIALLVYGALTANLPFVYAAIGVSVLAMILLGLGVFLQRDLLWGNGRGPAAGERAGESGEEPEPVAVASTARPGADSTATGSPDPGSVPGSGSPAVSGRTPAPARPPAQAAAGTGEPARDDGRERHPSGGPPDEADAGELVHVVPGRRRYHRAGCASLAGRVSEELTVEEAREEGFSACTVCFPAELAAGPAADTGPEAAAGPAELDTPVSGTPASTGSDGAAGTAPAEPTADAEPSTDAQPTDTQPTDTQPSATAAAGLARATEGTEATEGGEHTAPGGPGKPARASGETVWVVRGVSRYHRSDCVLIRSVDDEDVDTMTQADAEAADCTPCRACHAVDEPLAG